MKKSKKPPQDSFEESVAGAAGTQLVSRGHALVCGGLWKIGKQYE